jgi:ABC-2 type transport system ATP-binding protein
MQQGAIRVEGVRREFQGVRRRPGLKGAWQDLWRRDTYTVTAVDDLSFELAPGEIVGYIGANGAGKSTTIKMLTGIIAPTAGIVRVNGRDPQADRIAHTREIGVVFGQRTQLWWDLPVLDSLRLLQTVFQLDEATFQSRLRQFGDVLGLDELLQTPVRKLSLGQRMRCDIVACLMHLPPVVFLDEPTIGLDVAVKAQIRDFIRTVNRDHGTTFILTTHDLGDIEALCRRVMVIDGGRLIYDGKLEALKAAFGRERRLTFDLETPVAPEALAAIAGVDALWESAGPGQVACRFDGSRISPATIIAAVMAEFAVRDLHLQDTSIETIVQRIYRQTVDPASLPAGGLP